MLPSGAANCNGQVASTISNVAGKPFLNKVNNVFFHALDDWKFAQKGFHWLVMPS
jgi:hypothetical protein